MRRLVRIVEEGEYEAWLKGQTSYYDATIKGTDNDPFYEAPKEVEAPVVDSAATEEPVTENLESQH